MNAEKKPSRLNLKKENVPQSPAQVTVEDLKKVTDFYDLVGSCALNMSIALDKQAELTEQILVELSDIKDNLNRMGLKEGWLTEIDIDEREKEDDEPDKSEEPGN